MSDNKYTYKTLNGKKNRLHRHIMEAHVGRKLESHEHVYHIDGDPNNNDIANLILITKKYKS